MKNKKTTAAPKDAPPSSAKSERKTEAMFQAALVLGFNELAKHATSLGDQVAFRIYREEAHRKLKEMADTGWELSFAEPEPVDGRYPCACGASVGPVGERNPRCRSCP